MRVEIVEHPVVAHKLGVLRNQETDSATFRRMVHDLTLIVGIEATRELAVEPIKIRTPVAEHTAQRIASPTPVAVPILRAGLGMLDAFLEIVPTADSGFLGLKRNEKTLEPEIYANRLPLDFAGRPVFLLDPMVATGGSLVAAADILLAAGAASVTCVCLIGSPSGVEAVTQGCASKPVSLFIASVDAELNSSGYIVPGLGDAGDRLFGEA